MAHHSHRDALLILALGLGLCMPAFAEDTVPSASTAEPAAAAPADIHAGDWDDVMQLGKVDVAADKDEASRRIVAGLKVIKAGLKNDVSDAPADENKVVCRTSYDTGSHLVAHLMCATNHTLRTFKDQLHASELAGVNGIAKNDPRQILEHMNGTLDRDHYFSTKINASQLQKLLLQVQCDGCSNSGLVVGNN